MDRAQSKFFTSRYLPEVLLLLILISVAAVFQFNGLYGQDSHEYLRMVRDLKDFFSSGNELEPAVFPILYPFVGLLISLLTGNELVALQLLSMLAMVAAFHYLRKLFTLFYEDQKKITIYLFVFFVLSPYVLRFALLSMSDMLCTLFLVLSFYHAWSFYLKGDKMNAACAVLFGSAAVATRYAALIMAVPVLLFVFWSMIKQRSGILFLLCILLFFIPLIPDLLLRSQILFLKFSEGHISLSYYDNAYAWSVKNFLRNDFHNVDGIRHYDQVNLLYAAFNLVHPAFLFAGIILILFMRRSDFKMPVTRMSLALIIAYAVFIAGLYYQSNRYLLLTFPFVLIVLYPAFIRLSVLTVIEKFRHVLLPVIIIVQLSLFFYSSRKIYSLNQSEKHIATRLKSETVENIYTTSITGALQSYEVGAAVIDIYSMRLETVKANSLLLFNYPQFSVQFADRLPMENWKFFNENYKLSPVDSFDDGWRLYRVEELDS